MRAACIQNLTGSYGSIQNSAIWSTVARYSLDGLLIPMNQARMTDVDYITSKGLKPFLWVDPENWYGVTGAAAATTVNRLLIDMGFTGANVAKPCAVVFDVERHSIEDILNLIAQWRKARAQRETYWTMEPFQDSWVGDPQVISMVQADPNLVLVPQTYRGPRQDGTQTNMMPCAQDAVKGHLIDKGYPAARLKLFYGTFWRDPKGVDHLIPPAEGMDGMLWKMDSLSALSAAL